MDSRLQVKKFTNNIFSSNSYVLFKDEERHVYIVDPGDSCQIFDWLGANDKTAKGILLTHYHIDHIYGVNDIFKEYPDLKIYASESSLSGLFSAKLNCSYYMEMPYELTCKDIQVVDTNSDIELFNSSHKASIVYTPGHNNDCISYGVDDYLFTGDALIPGIRVHTKSKLGDKLIAQKTVIKILESFPDKTIICPGHKDMCFLKDIEVEKISNPMFKCV